MATLGKRKASSEDIQSEAPLPSRPRLDPDNEASPSTSLTPPTADPFESLLLDLTDPPSPPSSHSPLVARKKLEEWSRRLELDAKGNSLLLGEGEDKEEVQKGVSLTKEDALELSSLITIVVNSFNDTPATRGDIGALLSAIGSITSSSSQQGKHTKSHSSAGGLFSKILGGSEKKKKKKTFALANHLPTDVIALIIDQLREARVTQIDGEERYFRRNGVCIGWQDLRILAKINKTWRSVAYPLYRSELHISDSRMFPNCVKMMRADPDRGGLLTKLFMRVYDFELSYSKDDAGFSLPEVIRLAPNLLSLSVLADGRTSYRRRLRDVNDFDSYTGLHLPTIVASSLSLRSLKYGVPCSTIDVALFLSSLPELVELEVTGEVDNGPLVAWLKLPEKLKRFWCPSLTFLPEQLEIMLSGESRVTELGLTVDVDDSSQLLPTPPTEEEIKTSSQLLTSIFTTLGPQLTHLLLMSPAADLPDPGRMRITGAGGQIQIAFQTFGLQPPNPALTAALGLGNINQGGQPAAGGGGAAAGAGARNGGAAGAAAAGGQPQAAGGGANANANGNGNQNQNAGGGGGGGGGANNGGGLNVPFPFLFPFLGGGGGPASQTSPSTPFFDSVVESCPSLLHLELYGRRYTSSLLNTLLLLPLEHLSLSVPSDEERLDVVKKICKGLEVGGGNWEGLKTLELCGRGGEWESSERKRIKDCCGERGVVYSSTEMRS